MLAAHEKTEFLPILHSKHQTYFSKPVNRFYKVVNIQWIEFELYYLNF